MMTKVQAMRIYLGNCYLRRPLDNQTQPYIKVEAEVVFAVLAMVQAGEVLLCHSDAPCFISRIPDETRQAESLSLLTLASEELWVTDAAEALASMAKVDFFCACNDQ